MIVTAAVLLIAVQQPPVITPAQRAALGARGWPPAPPIVRPRDDLLIRRDGGEAVTGSLASLHAFAALSTSHGTVNVGRDQVAMILVNGALIPAGAPVLPLDSDAVVLTDGSKAVGRVEIDGDAIHVGGRLFQQSAVAMIRLRDPKVQQQQQQAQSAGGGAAGGGTTTGGGGAGASGAGNVSAGASAAGGARPKPRGPGEIPWGQAIWRGVVRFSMVTSSTGETESGMYYVTMAESAIGHPPYMSGLVLRVRSLVYQYQLTEPKSGSCAAFTANKQGSGVDGWNPELHSGGMMSLPMPGLSAAANANAGKYDLHLFTPVFIPAAGWPTVCTTGGPAAPSPAFIDGHPMPSVIIGNGIVEHECQPDPDSLRVPAPFTSIAGEITCGKPGVYQYLSMKWQFDRGVPPDDPTMNQDPCETPKGLLSLSQDQRQRAVDRLKQIAAEFAAAKDAEAKARVARDQLQPYFEAMLIASLASDAGQRLLQIALSDGMLKTSAATGQITEAQRDFVGNLNKFIKAYEAWTKFADNPGGWGESKLIGAAKEQAIGEDNMAIIEGAMELVGYGQILKDAVGQGDGSATLEYIEENMGTFGPLVPEYSINKARQYVEVSQQWSAALKTMARLSAEGANLAGQIAEADLGIAVRSKALADCVAQNHPK